MKYFVVVAVLLASALGFGTESTTAPAAKTAKKAVVKKVKKTVKKVETKVEAAKPVEAAPVATQATTAPAASTTSTEVSSAVAAASTETVAATAPKDAKFYGMLDLRTPYRVKNADVFGDHTIILGYQWTKNTKLSYWQGFDHNISDNTRGNTGSDFHIGGAHLRADFNKIWSNDSGAYFSDQIRTYLPTDRESAGKGMLTQVRNYFKVGQKFSNFYTLEFAEAPIFWVYNKPGSNVVFRNRVQVLQTFAFTDKLSLAFPIILDANKKNDSDTWGYNLWIYPEASYAITNNLSVGMAFLNDDASFVNSSFGDFSLGRGFRDGKLEFFLTASL